MNGWVEETSYTMTFSGKHNEELDTRVTSASDYVHFINVIVENPGEAVPFLI